MAIATTNPATGETVREFDSLTQQELEDRIQRSWDAFQEYRATTFEQRAGWMRAAADILDAETGRLAELGPVALFFRARDKITASTPEVPFGGAKNSGYGRELASFGTLSSVNAKRVWIQ